MTRAQLAEDPEPLRSNMKHAILNMQNQEIQAHYRERQRCPHISQGIKRRKKVLEWKNMCFPAHFSDYIQYNQVRFSIAQIAVTPTQFVKLHLFFTMQGPTRPLDSRGYNSQVQFLLASISLLPLGCIMVTELYEIWTLLIEVY